MPRISNLITQIEEAGLVGRGGACFPVAKKLLAVKESLKTSKDGYIIVNGAEGEPGVKKDGYIIHKFPEEVINGISLVDNFLGSKKIKKIYFFLNHEYYEKYTEGLKKILSLKKYSTIEEKLVFVIKANKLSYISGEESALLNFIEGKKVEPRLKPPYPTQHGLFNLPTLINNPETIYNISLVAKNNFRNERFYTITGAARHRGVFKFPADLNIDEVLHKTGNYPNFKFFVQIGGEAAGEVLNSEQLKRPVDGAGSIMIYDFKKTNHKKLVKYWLNFFHTQSCGNCTSCREGSYRLWELINAKHFDKKVFWELLSVLEETSFCALGRSLPIPIKSYYLNILKD
ncbi:MAG: NADH-ubiquinone oxidoreductase-F iron-sulfur binding region domain-containing protein [Patescibacteria group bacterium]